MTFADGWHCFSPANTRIRITGCWMLATDGITWPCQSPCTVEENYDPKQRTVPTRPDYFETAQRWRRRSQRRRDGARARDIALRTVALRLRRPVQGWHRTDSRILRRE